MQDMGSIDTYNFQGKRVIVRVDFNAPQNEQHRVMDTTRIIGVKPTISKILSDGGSVILITHLGRPGGSPNDDYSLRHILGDVSEILGLDVRFVADIFGEKAQKACREIQPGEVILLENLRFSPFEELGDHTFAKNIASLGDFYINDAFGAAHRSHASITGVPVFFPDAKCLGKLMEQEISSIQKVLEYGIHPITAILGGAKISTKIRIIERLLPIVDHLIIGGGMAYTFIRAQGGDIGDSLYEQDSLDLARDIIKKAEPLGVSVFLPQDSVVTREFRNGAETQMVPSDAIDDGWMGLDIGDLAILDFSRVIRESQTIFWNGPLGVFELSHFARGTIQIGDAIREATRSGAFSLVGGGDSVAFAKQYGYESSVSYVSTGGGAMLEFLEGNSLPGIDAILS